MFVNRIHGRTIIALGARIRNISGSPCFHDTRVIQNAEDEGKIKDLSKKNSFSRKIAMKKNPHDFKHFSADKDKNLLFGRATRYSMMNREELIGKIKFTYPLINETDYLILESYKKQVAINTFVSTFLSKKIRLSTRRNKEGGRIKWGETHFGVERSAGFTKASTKYYSDASYVNQTEGELRSVPFYLRNDISALLRFDRETQLRIFGSVALRPLRHPLFPSSENAPSLVSIEIFQDRRLSLPLPRELIDETDRNLEDLADREIRKRMLGSIERK